jgi:DNA-binding Xre family transcriptional regulator
MLSLSEIQNTLSDRNLSAVSRATGIKYDTIWRIAKNRVRRINYSALEKLSDYLEGRSPSVESP